MPRLTFFAHSCRKFQDFDQAPLKVSQNEPIVCVMYFDILLYLMTLICVAVASRGLLKAMTENVRYADGRVVYSVKARRIGRNYKVLSWAILLAVLMISFVLSFTEVFLSF